jgi:mRNA-degrading endonuclease RelE of RelBE toxin-antitoxin system
MDKIEKLLRKISPSERQRLFKLMKSLISGSKNLNVSKVTNTDFFRLKSGKFRIIFHYENKEVIIDAIKLRDKNTYKGL